MTKVIAPTALYRRTPDILGIRWNDGTQSELKVPALRSSCPCAVCVNEWTGEKILDEARIPADIKPARLISVGRYAMAIHWSDGHKTGIYSFDYLKKLGGDGSSAPASAPNAAPAR
ncbi:MAG: DUF971 domain-containing protein [Fibrobacteria bacterium]